MSGITLIIEGMDALMAKLQAKSPETKKKAELSVYDAALTMSEEAMKNLSQNGSVKTKTLIGSLGTQSINVSTDNLSASVETNIYYAAFVEYGTEAHIIEAKNAKVLTNGTHFFGKKVHHPGSKPKPYFRPAFEVARQKFLSRLNTLLG